MASEALAGVYVLAETAIKTLNVPYGAGTFMPTDGSDVLPDLFIEYSLVSSTSVQHADNVEKLRRNRVQVSIFSRSGLVDLPDVTSAMEAAGFLLGAARELQFDKETRHFGLALDYVYLMEE